MSIEEQEVQLFNLYRNICMRRIIDDTDPTLPGLVQQRDDLVVIYSAAGGDKWYGY